MKTITLEKLTKICKKLDWDITDYEDDNTVELCKFSPAGEDFVLQFDRENLIDNILNYWFDKEEHINLWIDARHSGTRGVPSTKELCADADAIDEMITELQSAIRKELS